MDLFTRFLNSGNQPGNQPTAPAFNLWADEESAVLASEIPGIEMDSLEITVTGRDVSVKGSRKEEEIAEGSRIVRRERGAGEFERAFQLPFQIDAARVSARLTNGTLEISLPRAETDKPRKINIAVG